MKTIDAIRAAYPHLGVAVYAYEPGGPVTLELLPPDGGESIKFVAPTLEDAVQMAFPDDPTPPVTEPEPPRPNVFD